MGWWTDIAEKRPTNNHGGAMYEQRGMVVHIAEGSYEGTIGWQQNPDSQVSSHFVVAKDGRIAQCVDTDVVAWTQADGNGKWLSVENEGYVTDGGLTDAQLDANAKLFARGAAEYGYPLTLATCPDDRGLGHHSMGAECGYNWGHSQCPGSAIKAQKPTIVDRAKGEDDVSAKDVWNYDVDPSQSGSYTGGGALWTTYGRTGYLANDFAPTVLAQLTALQQMAQAQQAAPQSAPRESRYSMVMLLLLVILALATGGDIVAHFVK